MEYKYITRESSTGLPVTLVTHDPKIVEKSLKHRIDTLLNHYLHKNFVSSDVTKLIMLLDSLRNELRMIELDIYGEVQ